MFSAVTHTTANPAVFVYLLHGFAPWITRASLATHASSWYSLEFRVGNFWASIRKLVSEFTYMLIQITLINTDLLLIAHQPIYLASLINVVINSIPFSEVSSSISLVLLKQNWHHL